MNRSFSDFVFQHFLCFLLNNSFFMPFALERLYHFYLSKVSSYRPQCFKWPMKILNCTKPNIMKWLHTEKLKENKSKITVQNAGSC